MLKLQHEFLTELNFAAATGPYWPKGARNKKKTELLTDRAILANRQPQEKKKTELNFALPRNIDCRGPGIQRVHLHIREKLWRTPLND